MKILIIQQKMIGDVLLTSILCQILKIQYKPCEVHYLINSNTLDITQNNPWIDHIIEFTPEYKKSKRALYRFLKSIGQNHYQLVIDVYSKPESNLISLFSRAKQRISYYKWYSQWLYTDTMKRLNSRHEKAALKNRLRLLKPLGIENIDKTIKPKVYLTTEEKYQAEKFLHQHNINPKIAKPIMINILGSSIEKSYPENYMCKVIDCIATHTTQPLLINYIPNQAQQVQKIIKLCSPQTIEQLYPNAIAKSLRDFLGILSHCSALIGNEGGAIHMAQALAIPTFAIFSPWVSKNEWNLYQDSWHRSVHLNDYKPELFLKTPKKNIKNSSVIYQTFHPDLFTKKLKKFLKQHHS